MIPITSLYGELAVEFYKHPLLRELIFPVCECLCAYITLYNKIVYYPLVLHVIEQLIAIMEKTAVRFSVCKPLMNLLKTKHLTSAKNAWRKLTFEFEIKARLSKEHIEDKYFWMSFAERVLFLLERYLLIIIYEPYFSSFANCLRRTLRFLLKNRIPLETKKSVVRLVI